jgi:hypothetical protein
MGHFQTSGCALAASVDPSIADMLTLVVAPHTYSLKGLIRWRDMMAKKLSPEGEIIAAQGAAVVAAFQVLINCLEESDALLPGQFPEALGVYMEMVKSRKGDVSDMTLAVLHDIRTATQD